MILGYDWPRLHAALNDLPAALLTVGVLFDLAAWAFKRESLKWAAIWTLWTGVVGGWLAVFAGLQAEEVIEHGEGIHELMEKHETLGLATMILFTVLLAWRLWRRFRTSAAEEWVLRILAVAGLVLVTWTGVVGGQMVFEHAAGVPMRTMEQEMQDRRAGHNHEAGEDADSTEHQSAGRDTSHVHAPGTPPHTH